VTNAPTRSALPASSGGRVKLAVCVPCVAASCCLQWAMASSAGSFITFSERNRFRSAVARGSRDAADGWWSHSAAAGTPICSSATRACLRRSQRCVGPISSYGRLVRMRGGAGEGAVCTGVLTVRQSRHVECLQNLLTALCLLHAGQTRCSGAYRRTRRQPLVSAGERALAAACMLDILCYSVHD
jgi:hypothetical protein